jgi:hypothetical protein
MKRKTIAYLLFALGVFFLVVHTVFPVLWQLSGLPGSYPLSRPGFLYYAQGFTPMLGVLILFVAGLVYEKPESPR